MRSKRARKCRSEKKISINEIKTVNEDGSDVFVLPPQLLQKLGINLSQVYPTEGNSSVEHIPKVETKSSKSNKSCIKKSKYESESKTETSILEIANLMTKSVFLSPTFESEVSTTGVMNAEVEFACFQMDAVDVENNIIENHCEQTMLSNTISIDKTCSKDLVKKSPNKESVDAKYLCEDINLGKSQEVQQSPLEAKMSKTIKVDALDGINSNSSSPTDFTTCDSDLSKSRIDNKDDNDNHVDEAYLSDSGNSNLGNADTVNILHTDTQPSLNINVNDRQLNNKITILSEETLNTTRFNEIMKNTLFSPKREDMFPVNVNDIVTVCHKYGPYDVIQNNNVKLDIESNSLQETMSLISKETSHNDESNNMHEDLSFMVDRIENITEVCSTVQDNNIVIEFIDKTKIENDWDKEVSKQENICLGLNMKSNCQECQQFSDTDIHLANKKSPDKKMHDILNPTRIPSESKSVSKEMLTLSDSKTEIDADTTSLFDRNAFSYVPNNEIVDTKLHNSNVQNVSSKPNTMYNDNIIHSDSDLGLRDEILNDVGNIIDDVWSDKQKQYHNVENLQNQNLFNDEKLGVVILSNYNTNSKNVLNQSTGSKKIQYKDLDSSNPIHVSSLGNLEPTIDCKCSITQSKHEHFQNDVISSPYSLVSDNASSNLQEKLNNDIVTSIPNNKSKVMISTVGTTDDRNKKETKSCHNNDKIKEIASYLEKYAHVLINRQNKIKPRVGENKRKYMLSNDGVEKPGGSSKENMVVSEVTKSIKTYRSSKKVPQAIAIYISPNTANNDMLDEKPLSVKNMNITLQPHDDFCTCSDFGRLSFYDKKDIYQHIHFQNKQITYFNRNSTYVELDYIQYIKNRLENMEVLVEDDDFDERYISICGRVKDNSEMDVGDELTEYFKYFFVNNLKMDIKSSQLKGIDKEIEVSNETDNLTARNPFQGKMLGQIVNVDEKSMDQSRDNVSISEYKSAKIIKTPTDELEIDIKTEDFEYHDSRKVTEIDNNCVKEECASSNKMITEINKQVYMSLDQSILDVLQSPKLDQLIPQHKYENDSKIEMKPETCVLNKSSNFDNKQLKCGVCKTVLSEGEWNDHIYNVHCFVAWKDGEKIDLNSDVLISDLNAKLKSDGILKCTFCGSGIKTVHIFMSHIKKCLKVHTSTEPNAAEFIADCKSELTKQEILENNQITVKDFSDSPELSRNHTTPKLKKQDKNNCRQKQEVTENQSNPENVASMTLPMEIDQTGSSSESSSKKLKDSGNKGVSIMKRSYKIPKLSAQKITNITVSNDQIHNCGKSGVEIVNGSNSDDDEPLVKRLKLENRINSSQDNEKNDSLEKPVKRKRGRPRKERNISEDKQDVSERELDKHDSKLNSTNEINESNNSIKKKGLKNSNINLTKIKKCSDKEKKSENNDLIECGVCKAQLVSSLWIQHIKKEHNYLAWKKGEAEIDLEDPKEVHTHLLKASGSRGLECGKCGLVRKYPKVYLQHVESCEGPTFEIISPLANSTLNDSTLNTTQTSDISCPPGKVICAVCLDQVREGDWKVHAFNKHYNIAWKVGDPPINLKNPYAAEKFLKEYKAERKNLVCNVCGVSRASYSGFYAHILTCGKTDEEVDRFKDVCEECNQKYLCIYRQQHLMAHREKELSLERKKLILQQSLLEKDSKNSENSSQSTGRRKAAVKAESVIENYTSEDKKQNYSCESCDFATDNKKELKRHKCGERAQDDGSDASVAYTSQSETDDDTDVDSNLSANEEDNDITGNRKKKKSYKDRGVRPNSLRLPFVGRDPNSYMQKAAKDFIKYHYTDEALFTGWKKAECTLVSDEELTKYLPTLEESCKLKIEQDWISYKRFEAKNDTVLSVFTGGTPQCVSWTPPRYKRDGDGDGNYLAVACHRAGDQPRYAFDQSYQHAALVQLWDFGLFQHTLPKLVLGIALDCGAIWGMDWCPSGGRDDPTEENPRLGLLAVAASNGLANIYAVPHPSSLPDRDKPFYKLKPVAELRLYSKEKLKNIQCTAISWSAQKDHETVVVGYSEGTVAFYHLNFDSPLCYSEEDGVAIFYPNYDEKQHSTCVTAVDTFAARGPGAPAVSSASRTAARAAWGAGAGGGGGGGAGGGGAAGARCCVLGAPFAPHWPSALLAGDAAGISELDFFGTNRRLGFSKFITSCFHCGIAVHYNSPLVRKLNAHPIFTETNKISLVSINMVPLSGNTNRHKKENTKYEMKLEPITYEGAVEKYGLEVVFINKKDGFAFGNNILEVRPERFPLSDVSSMAFCLSPTHHQKLAVATHSGIILIIHVSS